MESRMNLPKVAIFSLPLIMMLFIHGCAAKYTVKAQQPAITLQWPFQPAKPKAVYVHSFTGFSKAKSSVSLMKSFVYGSSNDNADAFLLPVAVATASDGRIAVADTGRRCVHLYMPAAKRYVRLYGDGKQKIASPVGLIFDDAFRLYISDSTGKVFVYDNQGNPSKVITNVGDQQLQRPTGIAYSPTKKLLFIVDTLKDKIFAVDSNGKAAFSFGERGVKNGQFNYPTHLFRSSSGKLYITDSMNFRVQIFDESGNFVGAFGHHGDGSGDLALPKGIAADPDGAIFVADGLLDNVQLFSEKGTFLLTIGQRGTDFGEFWLPSGIFIDELSNLYVCDTYNHRIQVFRITEHYDVGSL